jgi:hypothetical protein
MTFGGQCDEQRSHAILDAAAAGGIDFIDTANVYPMGGGPASAGRTEEIVGSWLKGKRHQFILATKCAGQVGHKPWERGMSLAGADGTVHTGETGTVTITFSENVTAFNNSDMTVTNGSLGSVSSADGGKTWTATFTPAATTEAAAHVSVANTYTDLAGNSGTASAADGTIAVDTKAPTVTITSTGTGGNPRPTTFTFSEAVSGFDSNDVKIVGATPGTITHVGINGSGQDVYTETITGANGSGSHTVQVVASGTGTSSWTDAAGNAGTGSAVLNLPAGVAGSPINLALDDPSGVNTLTRVTVAGVPADRSLNAGMNNGDGTWTIQTNDPLSLMVTTPTSWTGAMVLNVAESWTNADGTTGTASIADNVEAYAPGSPIFAVSGDDTLTGSSDADQFVFAQPIGNDTVHDFNTANDQIDLIGFANLTSFADIQAATTDNASGNAVIRIGAGESITLIGVASASLGARNFIFNQEPVTTNAATITIGDGAILPLGGTLDNTGVVALNSVGSETDLEVLIRGLTLQGGGQVTLSDNPGNTIFGGDAAAFLDNVDNTISGAGQIGAGQMTLANEGTIDASGSNALTIDTGSNVVSNAGTLKATGSGGLTVNGALNSSGLIWADGGNVVILGTVSGGGSALICGSAQLEFVGGSDAATSFDAGAAGTLKLDQSSGFSGSIAGFAAGDGIDLADLGFGLGSVLTYADGGTGTGGTLSVTDGTRNASLAMVGSYDQATFQMAVDATGGTMVRHG